MEVVSEIRSVNMFTFPVLTYSLLYKDGEFSDPEFARWCSDHNTKWNDANFFVSGDVTTLSNCCRLLSDTSKLSGFINSIGGTALSIGSVKVNTINLMKIAYEVQHYKLGRKNNYLEILEEKTVNYLVVGSYIMQIGLFDYLTGKYLSFSTIINVVDNCKKFL